MGQIASPLKENVWFGIFSVRRGLTAAGKIVSWTTPPTGIAADTLKFKLPEGTSARLIAVADGLYVRRGLFFVVR